MQILMHLISQRAEAFSCLQLHVQNRLFNFFAFVMYIIFVMLSTERLAHLEANCTGASTFLRKGSFGILEPQVKDCLPLTYFLSI